MNWGHKIAIVYILFAGGMVAMLIYSKTFKHELVTEDYYQKELHYQERIDAVRNMRDAPFSIDTRSEAGNLLVYIKGLDKDAGYRGKVNLYKPDNRSYDRSLDLKLDKDNRMVISPGTGSGRYRVEVSLELDGKEYISEKQVVL